MLLAPVVYVFLETGSGYHACWSLRKFKLSRLGYSLSLAFSNGFTLSHAVRVSCALSCAYVHVHTEHETDFPCRWIVHIRHFVNSNCNRSTESTFFLSNEYSSTDIRVSRFLYLRAEHCHRLWFCRSNENICVQYMDTYYNAMNEGKMKLRFFVLLVRRVYALPLLSKKKRKSFLSNGRRKIKSWM